MPSYYIPPDGGDILWYANSEKGSERRRIEGHSGIGIKNKKDEGFLVLRLKQDANNFVTTENCWNFVTIVSGTNDYVLSSK